MCQRENNSRLLSSSVPRLHWRKLENFPQRNCWKVNLQITNSTWMVREEERGEIFKFFLTFSFPAAQKMDKVCYSHTFYYFLFFGGTQSKFAKWKFSLWALNGEKFFTFPTLSHWQLSTTLATYHGVTFHAIWYWNSHLFPPVKLCKVHVNVKLQIFEIFSLSFFTRSLLASFSSTEEASERRWGWKLKFKCNSIYNFHFPRISIEKFRSATH